MSPLDPPTAADYAANRSPGLIAGNLVGAILATVAVALRFGARWIQGKHYGIDDLLIVFSMLLGWGMAVTTIIATRNGLGKHLNTLLPDKAAEVLTASKAYFASEIIWTVAILSTKTSILILYNRLFGTRRHFRYTTIGLGVFTLCWALTTLFVIIFQCTPVSKAYNMTESGHCIKSTTYFIIGSSLDCAVDIAIFILPMYEVWHLHLSTIKRILLSITFAIGSASVAFGLTRLAIICSEFRNPDWTWGLSGVALWSTLEPCLAITAICLATTRPLYSYSLEKYHQLSSAFSSRSRSSKGSANMTNMTSQMVSPEQSRVSNDSQATRVAADRTYSEEDKFEEFPQMNPGMVMEQPSMLSSEIHIHRDFDVRAEAGDRQDGSTWGNGQ